jgi:hypothetical protein
LPSVVIPTVPSPAETELDVLGHAETVDRRSNGVGRADWRRFDAATDHRSARNQCGCRSDCEDQFTHHPLPVHLGYLKVSPKKAICSARQPVVARCDAPEVLEAAERASEMGQISG